MTASPMNKKAVYDFDFSIKETGESFTVTGCPNPAAYYAVIKPADTIETILDEKKGQTIQVTGFLVAGGQKQSFTKMGLVGNVRSEVAPLLKLTSSISYLAVSEAITKDFLNYTKSLVEADLDSDEPLEVRMAHDRADLVAIIPAKPNDSKPVPVTVPVPVPVTPKKKEYAITHTSSMEEVEAFISSRNVFPKFIEQFRTKFGITKTKISQDLGKLLNTQASSTLPILAKSRAKDNDNDRLTQLKTIVGKRWCLETVRSVAVKVCENNNIYKGENDANDSTHADLYKFKAELLAVLDQEIRQWSSGLGSLNKVTSDFMAEERSKRTSLEEEISSLKKTVAHLEDVITHPAKPQLDMNEVKNMIERAVSDKLSRLSPADIKRIYKNSQKGAPSVI